MVTGSEASSSGVRSPDKRYVRHPYLTALLLFLLAFAGIMIFSLLPIPLFLSLNPNFGNLRMGDLPEGTITPEIGEPNWDLLDFLDDILDNLPDNFPGFLDFMNREMFNATTGVPTHRWRQTAQDIYDGTNSWDQSDLSVSYGNLVSSTPLTYTQVLTFNESDITSMSTVQELVPLHESIPGSIGIEDIYFTNGSGGFVINASDYSEILSDDAYDGTAAISGPLMGQEVFANYQIVFEDYAIPAAAQNSNLSLVPSGIITQYTQLPSPGLFGLSTNVTDYALELNASFLPTDSIYDKAVFIEQNVSSSFTYDLFQYFGIDPLNPFGSTPTLYQVPAGIDAVYDFIFNRGWGICQDFAAAHVVLLRLLGIPARYVLGFAPGDRVGAVETVKAMHAHAWTEVYLPLNNTHGIWWAFEPTAGGGGLLPGPPGDGEINEGDGGDGDLDIGPPGDPGGSGDFGGGDFGDGFGSGGSGFGGGEGVWGFGDFGPSGMVVHAQPATLSNRSYWKMNSYDNFDLNTWTKNNQTYNNVTNVSASTSYQVIIDFYVNQNGSGFYPLPVLSPIANLVDGTFSVTKMDAKAGLVNYSKILYDENYGAVYWNVTINGSLDPGDPSWFQISYNVTYNGSYDGTYSAWSAPIQSMNNPGIPNDGSGINYTVVPSLPVFIQNEIDQFRNHPQLTDVNETVLAVMEYFKTNFSFTPEMSGTGFDIAFLIQNGYGTAAQITSAFITFLRDLNISSRFVYGGVGLDPADISWVSNDHYWAEVWIEDTSGFGDWVQFDPVPLPKQMYSQTSSSWFDPRVPDEKVDTMHYDVDVVYNTTSNITRGTTIEFTGSLSRDGQIITTNLLNEAINMSFYDMNNATYLAQDISVNGSGHANAIRSFSNADLVGPHPILASFNAIFNDSVIGVIGPTNITLTNVNPYDPLPRGANFTATGFLEDPVVGQPLYTHPYIINISNPNQDCLTFGIPLTTMSGFQDTFQVQSSHPAGALYNLTARFGGWFFQDWPIPYNYTRPSFYYVPGTENVSSNFTVNLKVGSQITNKIVYSDLPGFEFTYPIVAGYNTTINGTLFQDDGLTPIVGETVDIHWDNGTDYIIGTAITDGLGNFSYKHDVPLSEDPNNVTIWVAFNETPSIFGCESVHDPPTIYRVNIYVNSITPGVATIESTQITITGNVTILNATDDPVRGYDNLSYHVIVNGTGGDKVLSGTENVTDANGEFIHSFIVPGANVSTPGNYSISIRNSTYPMIIVNQFNQSIQLNLTTNINNPLINGSVSTQYFQLTEGLNISGTLLDNIGNGVQNQYVNASILGVDIGSDQTSATGYFEIITNIPDNALLLGSQNVVLNFSGTNLIGVTTVNMGIYIFNKTIINVSVTPASADIITNVVLAGRLRDETGTGLVGRSVEIRINGSSWVIPAVTGADGVFQQTIVPLIDLNPPVLGFFNTTSLFLGAFPNASYNWAGFTVQSSSGIFNLTVNGSTNFYVQQGEPVNVSGHLADGTGTTPWANENVSAHLNGRELGWALTDAAGYFEIIGNVESTNPLGNDQVQARFNGTPLIVQCSDIANVFVFDDDPSNINLEYTFDDDAFPTWGVTQGFYEYGEIFFVYGRVETGGGDPIVGRDILLYQKNLTDGNNTELATITETTGIGGLFIYSLQAAGLGRWNFTFSLQALAPVNSSHSFNYNLEVNATTLFSSTITVNSSSNFHIQRGEFVEITGTLYYLYAGITPTALVNENVSAHIGGYVIGNTTTDLNGDFNITGIIPLGASLGPDTITLMYNGSYFEFIEPSMGSASVTVFDENVNNLNVTCSINGAPQYSASYMEIGVRISGLVTSNSQPVSYRTVNIYVTNETWGMLINSTQTDGSGTYLWTMDPVAGLGRFNITVELVAKQGKNSSHSYDYNIEANFTSQFSSLQIYNWDTTTYEGFNPAIIYSFDIGLDSIDIIGALRDQVTSAPLSGKTIELWIGGVLQDSDSTDGTGSFQLTYVPVVPAVNPISAAILFLDPDPFVMNITQNYSVHFYTTPQLMIFNVSSAYRNEFVTIQGNLSDFANLTQGVAGKQVTIEGNLTGVFQVLGTTITDSSGGFSLTVRMVSSYSSVNISVSYHTVTAYGTVTNLGIRPFDPTFLLIILLIVVIGAVVAAVGAFAVVKFRRYREDVQAKDVDIVGNKNKIQALLDGGRINEAIIFLYMNLEHVLSGYLKIRRKTGRTNREFILGVIPRVENLDSDDLLGFLALCEEARFSTHQLHRTQYQIAETIYNRLAKNIVEMTPNDVLEEQEEQPKPPQSIKEKSSPEQVPATG